MLFTTSSGRSAAPRMGHTRTSTQVHTGAAAVAAAGATTGELHEVTGTHVMGRWAWLQTCLDHDDRRTPVAVVVTGPDGQVEAAAFLAVGRRGPLTEVVALGHGRSDATALAARSDAAADELARAVAGVVTSLRGPWLLTLRHLPAGDPVALRIAAALPHSRRSPDTVSPRLTLTPGRDLRSYAGKHYVKNRRRRVGKLAERGTPVEVASTRDPEAIARALPEVLDVGRRRDQQMEREGFAGTPAGAAQFASVVSAHARRGEMLLVTARIAGALAGYALCFVDGAELRVWNCRFDPTWAEFGIGQICRAALIEHAIVENVAGNVSAVDWMLGDEPYKAELSNGARPAEDLYAASGRAVAAFTALALAVRAHARAATGDDAAPPRWVRLVRALGRPLLGS